MDTYFLLQHYWYLLVSLLGAILVFLLFVQGGQSLIYTIGKTEIERSMLVNTLGRKWEFTFTTLVTFGGAFFASFPLFYSTSFGGAYWVWLLILLAFVLQAVSYEFRTKTGNFLGQKTYEIFLIFNGFAGTILIGTAVATLFTGAEFTLSDGKAVLWQGAARGLEAALDFTNPSTFHNLSLGLAVFFLSRILGLMYFLNSIRHDAIEQRSKKQLLFNTVGFLFFFLTFVIWLFLRDGFAYHPETKEVFLAPNKYFLNMVEMPVLGLVFLTGVVLVLFSLFKALFTDKPSKSIWFAGAGTILTVLALLLCAGYNYTCFYPSTFGDMQDSLTIENASSSKYTLTVMSYVSILIPFVLTYIYIVLRAMNKKKLNEEEITSTNEHFY